MTEYTPGDRVRIKNPPLGVCEYGTIVEVGGGIIIVLADEDFHHPVGGRFAFLPSEIEPVVYSAPPQPPANPSYDSIVASLKEYADSLEVPWPYSRGDVIILPRQYFFPVGVVASYGLDEDGDYLVAYMTKEGKRTTAYFSPDELIPQN